MVTAPENVNEALFFDGLEKFAQDDYDDLREFVQAVDDSEMDLSDILMNVQGQDLGVINGVEAPDYLESLTISEFILSIADVDELEEYDIALESAFTSWQAGALEALKSD